MKFQRLVYLLLLIILGFSGCSKLSGTNSGQVSVIPGSSANLMSPNARLRKASLHIRGLTPTQDEYGQLQDALNRGEAQAFYQKKVSEYLGSKEYWGKMIERLDELFEVRPHTMEAELIYSLVPDHLDQIQEPHAINAMDLLFLRLVRDNLSWDELFLNSKYQLNATPVGFMETDLGFFNAVDPTLPPSDTGVIKKPSDYGNDPPASPKLVESNFNRGDLRVAGAVTTARFVERYNTTNVNKNRRRAAAIFRIFLCDDMKPVVPSSNDISDLLDLAFPKTNGAPILTDEQRHGSSPDCMGCHHKLDPLGRTFDTTGNVLSPEPAPGALVYERADGMKVFVPVKGLGDLALAVVQQPEYAQCQVQHFWNWFIGKDLPLSADRLSELTNEFNRVGRKPKEFISYLLNQAEFSQSPSSSFSQDVTLLQVRPIFQQCSMCHQGVKRKTIPDFTVLPIGGSQATHVQWLKKMANSLDLVNGGADAYMPPDDSGWRLKPEETNDIRIWIVKGARDTNGIPTISSDVANEIIPPKLQEARK